jgi:type VI secretion system Hcp family effector
MAIDSFLELLNNGEPAIHGETLDSKFHGKQAVQLLSFEIDSKVDLSMGAGSDLGGDDGNLFTFSVSKEIDSATPDLINGYAKYWKSQEVTWDQARVVIRKAGGKQIKFMQFDFDDVYIKSWSLDGKDGDEPPEENIEFCFRKVKITYWAQKQTGTYAQPNEAYWDFGRPGH